MRVLVAEDHPALAQSIANGLREEGYAVDMTLDGAEALKMAQATPYDCVVLDMMLPNKEGWEIIPTLRKENVETPVICLTARDAVEDRINGLDLGADDYMVKPFAWEELLARVRSVIRRKHGRSSAVITIGDMEIDVARKIVRRGGQDIELSNREFMLLEYLAHKRDEVVSRADISKHLYNEADAGTSNVVDVYIGYLRNKIDRNFNLKLIHTRRGHGYMLSDKAM